MIELISAAALESTEEFSEDNVLMMAIVFGVLAALLIFNVIFGIVFSQRRKRSFFYTVCGKNVEVRMRNNGASLWIDGILEDSSPVLGFLVLRANICGEEFKARVYMERLNVKIEATHGAIPLQPVSVGR